MSHAHISLTSLYIGKRVDLDFSQSFSGIRVLLPSYIIFNLAGDYEFHKNYSLTIRLNNIFNKQYEEIFGYTALNRTVLIGIEKRF
jgi:vitamin B12 transporter